MGERRIHVWVQEFQDRPFLVLQWHDPGTGKRRSKATDTADPKRAEDLRADFEADLNNGRYQEASKLDWHRFRDLFEAEYLAGLRERTREKYKTVLDVFEEIISPDKLRTVTERTVSLFVQGMRQRKRPSGKVGLAPMTIKNYLIATPRPPRWPRACRSLAPMTIKNYLIALKTALAWATSQGMILAVPTFPKIKVPKKKPQPIPAGDFEKLLAIAPDDLWKTFLLCGWWGGMRLSEARCLRWDRDDTQPWLDLDNNRIILPAVFAKSDEDQWVPLHPVLREALESLPRVGALVFPFRSTKGGGPLSRNGITNRVIFMAQKAGIKLSMHRLRKGFGCRVAKQLGKGNAPILHRLMRHSSMQVTMDYYASVDDALQDSIKGLT